MDSFAVMFLFPTLQYMIKVLESLLCFLWYGDLCLRKKGGLVSENHWMGRLWMWVFIWIVAFPPPWKFLSGLVWYGSKNGVGKSLVGFALQFTSKTNLWAFHLLLIPVEVRFSARKLFWRKNCYFSPREIVVKTTEE